MEMVFRSHLPGLSQWSQNSWETPHLLTWVHTPVNDTLQSPFKALQWLSYTVADPLSHYLKNLSERGWISSWAEECRDGKTEADPSHWQGPSKHLQVLERKAQGYSKVPPLEAGTEKGTSDHIVSTSPGNRSSYFPAVLPKLQCQSAP